VLKLRGKNPVIKLFGFYVRYFLSLKSNYFGYYNHFINVQQYRERKVKRDNQPQNSGLNESFSSLSPPKNSNALELYLFMELEDVVAFLPLHLYSSKQQADIRFQKLVLEVRYLPVYLDLYADFSPLTIHVPITTKECESPLCQAFGIKSKSYISISNFTFRLHFMYGPAPSQTDYAERYNVQIGHISGRVLLSQITSLGTWLNNFFFHLSNKDNSLSSHELIDEEQPLHSTITLRVRDVVLQLWASESVTDVTLAEGIRLETSSLIDSLAHYRMCMQIIGF
jgi:hypothetical protein